MSYWLTYLKKVKLIALIMKVLNIPLVYGGILSVLAGGLIGCTPFSYLGLAQTPVTPIEEITPQPKTETDPQEEAFIYLEGKVVDRAPFMESGSYQLQDETGTVWVLTNGELPETGEQIIIKGKVAYESIDIEGQDLGEMYIVEVEKLEDTASTPTSTTEPVASPEVDPETQTNFDERLLPHKRNEK
ncbi:MAG: DNA-binding protein [Cyanobacteria bacterium P01_G01_bin.49]